MSNLLDFAKSELEFAGYFNGDEMNQAMADGVLQLLEVFSEQGHSGFSASFAVSLFKELASFKPITPLTGEDDEWFEVTDGVYQNKRYSGLFKQADRFDGKAYDINGKVFRDPDGGTWTNSDSFVPVEFPYTPTTEIVEREEEFNNENN
jgi:hypothetical protein